MAMDDIPDRARAKLIAQEKRTRAAILKQFIRLEKTISAALDDLLFQIEVSGKAGIDPGVLLFEKRHLVEILILVQNEIHKIAPDLAAFIEKGQSAAIEIAKWQASQDPQLSTRIQFFDLESTRSIAGQSANGEPLTEYFKTRLTTVVQDSIFRALTAGIAIGKSNQEIAADLKKAVPNGAINAMTTARTETNRAYRESSRKFYKSTPGVIGWRWISALEINRTCPICWSRHGEIFQTNKTFDTHPNCRCTMIAVFASKKDAPFQTGIQAFETLNAAQQTAILGPRRFELFESGIKLKQFVGVRETEFGKTPFLKNLSDFE
jgi:SPP1 gp7 family putative phage head morphogenesis protein